MDDTLVKTDLFIEGLLRCILTRPFLLLKWLIWDEMSKSELKEAVAEKFPINYDKLPYRESVVRLIDEKKCGGYTIVLASGANQKHVEGVAKHLKVFDAVLGSSQEINNTGKTKLENIRNLTQGSDFEYVGNSKADFPIFEQCSIGYLVTGNRSLQQKFSAQFANFNIYHCPDENIWYYDSKILRPHQWAKNAVFFLPVVTGIGLYELNRLWLVAVTFCLMSLLASVVYIFNDIADLEGDRKHNDRARRCFASGEVPVLFGFLVGVSLLLLVALSLLLWRPDTWIYFALYFFLTVAYTMVLKEIAILDIFILVSFYILRILIGIETLQVPNSIWLMSFCILLFANLAFLKRYIEVNKRGAEASRRNYDERDQEFLRTSGITSILASCVLLILYAKSDDFSEFYRNTDLFCLITVPYSLMMLRMWYLASRNQVDSDPLLFTIKSPISYIAVILSTTILYLSR